jgi:HPt (histidine-containing phosphotransfer) domain-containing protein
MYNTPEFQALRREYLQGALERCGHLRAEADRLRAGGPVDLAELRQEVHKFRGSGGFYGFQQLSAASGTAEDQMILILDGEADRDDLGLAGLVDRVVEAVHEAAADAGL